jgi:hypothetical protein
VLLNLQTNNVKKRTKLKDKLLQAHIFSTDDNEKKNYMLWVVANRGEKKYHDFFSVVGVNSRERASERESSIVCCPKIGKNLLISVRSINLNLCNFIFFHYSIRFVFDGVCGKNHKS